MSWDDNRADKESIISEAWSVAETDDFRWGSQEMANLMSQWKSTGFAGPDDNDRLWDEFNSARQHFFSRRDDDRDRREQEREENRSDKEDLLSDARSLARSTDWKNTHEEIQQLRRNWKNIGSAGRDYDQQLWNDFNDACQEFYDNRTEFYEEREREREANASRKESLVSDAKSLARSTDWKATHESLQDLRKSWKSIGPAGRDRDQELWEEFNEACQEFYENRTRFYEEREREREANASRKESLVSDMESLSRSTDWKETHSEIQSLRNQWKSIGPAGRDKDDDLWERFNRASQNFYDNRSRAFEKREQERAEASRKKESIISRAKNLVNPNDWDSAHEDMKDLMDEWKQAGSAGRDDQDLWSEFNRVRQNFFEHYKAWKAARKANKMSQQERDQRDIERTLGNTLGRSDSKFYNGRPWGGYEERGKNERGNVIYLENKAPILAFIAKFQLPERLKLKHEIIQNILLEYIACEVALGRSYQHAAATALLELDGKTIDTHIHSGEEDFDLSYTLEDELIKAITEAYK